MLLSKYNKGDPEQLGKLRDLQSIIKYVLSQELLAKRFS